MYRVVEIEQTCEACPSQWEGKLDDGKSVYIRYRWGWLSVYVSKGPSSKSVELDWPCVFEVQLGDTLDGTLSYDQLLNATADAFQFVA